MMYYYNKLSEAQQHEALFKRDVQMSTIYQEIDRLAIWYNLSGNSLFNCLEDLEDELLEAIAEKEFEQMEFDLDGC